MLRLISEEIALKSALATEDSKATPELFIECYDEVSSTMDRARELCKGLMPGQLGLVRAQHQRDGRGRDGRPWENAVEGCGGTFCFKVSSGADGSRSHLAGLSLAVGLAVLDSCESFGCTLQVKWPNDIFSPDGKKLAGILIESANSDRPGAQTTQGEFDLLIGIGINLRGAPLDHAICLESLCDQNLCNQKLSNQDLPSSMAPDKNILEKKGAIHNQQNLHLLTLELINQLNSLRQTFFQTGFSNFRQRWLQKGWRVNQEITIRRDGKEYKGIFMDLGPNGELILDSAQGLKSFLSGEVGGSSNPAS